MSRAEVKRARSVCYLCPVRRECLEAALHAQETWGVWGGLTPNERMRALGEFRSVAAVLESFDHGDLEERVVRL